MERHIAVPFSEEELKELHAGDYIYLTGTIYSARDAAHKRRDAGAGETSGSRLSANV